MYFADTNRTDNLGALRTLVQQQRLRIVSIKELLAPPATAQAAIDELKQLQSKSLIDANNVKRQTFLKQYVQRYVARVAGVSTGKIQTFDVLAKYLKDNFHRLGARGVTPGADSIRKFDVYTASAILTKADGTAIPEYVLKEAVDLSFSPGKYIPGAAQKMAYQFLVKADSRTLPVVLQDLKKEIIETGAPAIISPPRPDGIKVPAASISTVTSTVATMPAVVSSEPTDVSPGVPLFTEAAAGMGGIGGLAILALGIYIFLDSGKRAFKSGGKRKRG